MADLLEVNGVDPSGLLRYKEYAKPETVKQYQRSANRQAIETTLSTPAEYNTGHFFNGTSSMFDEGMGVSNLENIQDWRANEQPGYMKAAAAIVHGATAAGSTILESDPYVLGFAALSSVESDESSIVDKLLRNPVFSAIGKLSEGINQATPIYQTKESQAEQENSVAANLFSYQGLDNLLTGIGFLAGAQAGAKGIYEALGEGKGAANYLKKLALGEKGVALNETDAAWGALADKIGKFGAESSSTLLARIPESYMEADQTYKQALMDGKKAGLSDDESETQAKDAMHKNFMFNMALSSMDLFQNIKIFKTFEKSAGELEQAAARAAKSGKVFTTARKLGYTGLKALEGIPFEQEEEGLQYSSDIAARESAKYGADFMSTFKDEYGKSWTDTQGQVSRIMGGLMGAGGAAFASKGNTKKIDELAGQYKQMLQQQTLNNNENAITSNNVYTTIQDENGNSTQVVNKAFVDNANTFTKLEGIKQVALQNQDKDLYDYASELQLMNKGLAHLQTGTYDDFIDDLKLTEQDAQQGPTNKALIGSETADEKIKKLEDLKKVYNHINANSEFSNLTQDSKMPIYKNIIDQKTAFKTLIKIKPKLETLQLENKTAAVVLGIKEEDIKENEFEYLDPVQQAEGKRLSEQVPQLEKLNNTLKKEYQDFKTKERVTNDDKSEDFKDTNKVFVPYVENIVKDQEDAEKDAKLLDDLKAEGKPIEYKNPETGEVVLGTLTDDGVFVDNVTGQPTDIKVEDILFQEKAKQQEVDDNKFTADIEITDDKIDKVQNDEEERTSAKKESQLSSSIPNHKWIGKVKSIVTTAKERMYELHEDFKSYMKFISNPTNSPNITTIANGEAPIITFKAVKGEIADLVETNNRRKQRSEKLGFDIGQLNPEALEHSDYMPIKLIMYINGIAQSYTSFFHDVDAFYETSIYDKMAKLVEKGELKEEEFDTLVKKYIQQQKNIRAELVAKVNSGEEVFLLAESKSEGIINYNPKNEKGVTQVNSIFEISNWGSNVLDAKTHNKLFEKGSKKPIQTFGVGVVTNIDEEKQKSTVTFTNGKSKQLDYIADLGDMVLDVVSTNGSTKIIHPFTRSKFTETQHQDLANLIYYRLSTNTNEVNGKPIISGNGLGIVDSLIFTGFVKDADRKSSQLAFDNEGNLNLGKKVITKQEALDNPKEVTAAILAHLKAYKTTPQFKLNAFENYTEGFSIPKLVEGKFEVGKTSSYSDFLFKGENPLIGTNVNSQQPFVGIYYNFAKDERGLITSDNAKNSIENPSVTPKTDIERRKSILLKKANLSKAPEFAQKAIAKTVEAIDEEVRLQVIEKAYNGITATPIATELGLTTEQVRSIRTYYGVPDVADKIDYENWKKGINAELAVSDIQDKKADIERRRQIELEITDKIKTLKTFFERGVSQDAVYKGKSAWGIEQEDLFKNAREALNSIVNAKYDAELAALETPKTEVSGKIEDTTVPDIAVTEVIKEQEAKCAVPQSSLLKNIKAKAKNIKNK